MLKIDAKLTGTTFFIFSPKMPQDMSLTAYPIDLKHINTREDFGGGKKKI